MCCFSTKQAALMRKGKEWLARNQDKVSVVEQHAKYFFFFKLLL
jgi:hypothetical protein